jgi:D-sedoheptulose 7-phosphate isomerase
MNIIEQSLKEHTDSINSISSIIKQIEKLANKAISTLKNGNKILIMGNGGSAADSQHFATEIVVRYKKNRRALPAIALSTDTSILTAAGNDISFEMIFARQIEALAAKNDLVLGISTSGNSANIIKGLETAKKTGCVTACLTGNGGGDIACLTDLPVIIKSGNTPRVQECHIFIIHTICEMIEEEFCK